MTDQERSKFLPNVSLTKGIDVHCDQCGRIAFVETMVEARAEAQAHKAKHRDG